MYSTEHSYATGAIRALSRIGFTIDYATDGEERVRAPLSATAAVDHVRGTDHGAVVLVHPTLGRLTLCLLFQNGEPEEVIYDMSAQEHATLDVVDAILEPLMNLGAPSKSWV